jgi:hypothetical protein
MARMCGFIANEALCPVQNRELKASAPGSSLRVAGSTREDLR